MEHPRKEIWKRVIREGSLVNDISTVRLRVFIIHCPYASGNWRVPVMNWVLKVGPTDFVVEGNLIS